MTRHHKFQGDKRAVMARLKEQQGHRCATCGGVLPDEYSDTIFRQGGNDRASTIEHINPINNGGPDDYANLAAVHRMCNLADRYEAGLAIMLLQAGISFTRTHIKIDMFRVPALRTIQHGLRIAILPSLHLFDMPSRIVNTYKELYDLTVDDPQTYIVCTKGDIEGVISYMKFLSDQPGQPRLGGVIESNFLLGKSFRWMKRRRMIRTTDTLSLSRYVEHYCLPSTAYSHVVSYDSFKWFLEVRRFTFKCFTIGHAGHNFEFVYIKGRGAFCFIPDLDQSRQNALSAIHYMLGVKHTVVRSVGELRRILSTLVGRTGTGPCDSEEIASEECVVSIGDDQTEIRKDDEDAVSLSR